MEEVDVFALNHSFICICLSYNLTNRNICVSVIIVNMWKEGKRTFSGHPHY